MPTRAAIIATVAASLVAAACSTGTTSPEPDTPEGPRPASMALTPEDIEFSAIAATRQIEALVLDTDNKPMSVPLSWKSAHPAVAAVDDNGFVTAVAPGTTVVTATTGAISGKATVRVAQVAASVELSPATVGPISTGISALVRATVKDANDRLMTAVVSWTTGDPAIATIDGTGRVTAVSGGTTTFTASVNGLSATGTVLVTEPIVTAMITLPTGVRDTIRGVGVQLPIPLQVSAQDELARPVTLIGGEWKSSDPSVASIDQGGQVHTHAVGTVQLSYVALNGTAQRTIEVVRMRQVAVDPYLSVPAAGALWEVPVIVIEYLPTDDGVNIDVTRMPDFWWLNPMSLDAMEANNLAILKRRKMMVEQGSRFRGYADAAALPSLGYRVVRHIIVYDQIPPHPTKRASIPGQPRFEDWHAVMADLNLAPLMTANMVRELWVAWSAFDGNFPVYADNPAAFDVDDMRVGWESNMVSPTTADISNSDRDPNDAPKLSHTYIIYGVNTRRSQAEAVHNVGHQLEAMLSHISTRQTGNDRFFWEKFVGVNAQDQFTGGRAGWTHMPPNTTGNYDYLNPTLVPADIEDWRPDNAGQKKAVNADTWGTLTYPWPGETSFGQRVESQWYTYWFQNFPGRGNQIPHGTSWMTNWWSFVANWDAAINSNLGLFSVSPAASLGSGLRAAVRLADPADAAWEVARWPVPESRVPRR